MQRDKGYGGEKRKRLMAEVKRNHMDPMSLDEDGCPKLSGRSVHGSSSDEVDAYCKIQTNRRRLVSQFIFFLFLNLE